MRTINVGELKTRFSEILKEVEQGEKVIIAYGKQSKKLAVIVPFAEYMRQKRKVGILAERGTVVFSKDWEMSANDLLLS